MGYTKGNEMVNLNKKNIKYIIFSIVFAELAVLPFLPLIITGFSFAYKWPDVFPEHISFRAFKYVFYNNQYTYEALLNTIIIGISVIIIDLLLAVPASAALGRYEFKGKLLIKMVLFAPIIVPPFTAVMGIYTTFIKLNLTESIEGVIIAHILPTLPYMIEALMIAYSTLDTGYEEQACILGASSIKRFYYIILPHLLPSIIAGSSLIFLISESQYYLNLLVGGGNVITLSVIMIPYINGGDRAIGSIYSIIFSATATANIFLLNLILKKYYKNKCFKLL